MSGLFPSKNQNAKGRLKLKPAYLLAAFMIAVLFFTGMVAITTNALNNMLPPPRNQLFGGVLLLYALMRYSRLRRQLQADKQANR